MLKLNLRNKIFLFVSAITLGLIVSTFLIVNYRLSMQVREAVNSNLQATQLTFDKLQRFRYDQLLKNSIIVSESPKLKGLISTGDPPTIMYGIKEFNEDLKADLVFVTDRRGIVLGKLDNSSYGENLSGNPLIRDALEGYDSENTFWEADGKLYQVVSIPVILQNEVLGTLTAGFEMNDSVASELKELTGSEISFAADGQVVGSTLGAVERSDLKNYLSSGELELPSPGGENEITPKELVLQKERYLALCAPLEGGAGQMGTYVMLNSLDKALAPLMGIRRTLIVVGVLGIAAGLVVSYFISNGITSPIKRLVKGSEEIGSGNYDYQIDATSSDEIGYLGESFNRMAVNLKASRESLVKTIAELRSLNEVGKVINSTLNLDETLHFILQKALQLSGTSTDAADVLLLNPQTSMLEYAAGSGFRTAALRYTRLRLGEGYAGRAVMERRIVGIPNLPEATGDLTRAPLLAEERFIAYYAAPLIVKGEVKGVLEIFHRTTANADRQWLDFLEALSSQAAISINNAELFADLALAYDTTLEGWAKALELRDEETEGHTQRVTEMTVSLAQAMGFKDNEVIHIRRGALLHDIGKMGIPDRILLKPGPLTAEEQEIMRRHPAYAYDMLYPITYLRSALDIPYCHHEKWDGTGYPRRLRGEEIPMAARLFAVVDVWDALRSNRPYRASWPAERVREHIRSLSGTHFDSLVVRAFLEMET